MEINKEKMTPELFSKILEDALRLSDKETLNLDEIITQKAEEYGFSKKEFYRNMQKIENKSNFRKFY